MENHDITVITVYIGILAKLLCLQLSFILIPTLLLLGSF